MAVHFTTIQQDLFNLGIDIIYFKITTRVSFYSSEPWQALPYGIMFRLKKKNYFSIITSNKVDKGNWHIKGLPKVFIKT